MLSILPKHIAARVKTDIRNIFQHIKTHQSTPLKKKPFRLVRFTINFYLNIYIK